MKNININKTLCIFISTLYLLVSSVVSATESSSNDAERETINNTQYLLANVLQKAKALQEVHGDFAPFGAGLFKSGAVKYVWYAKPGETLEEPAKALPIIRQALQAQAAGGAIVGSAVAYKVKSGQKPNLVVELEYQTGFSIAFASEIITLDDGKVEWGPNSQQAYDARVFNSEALKAQEEVVKKAKSEEKSSDK